MHYELVTLINPQEVVWEKQKSRIKDEGKILSVSPYPDFSKVMTEENVQGINIISNLTKLKYHPDDFCFFNSIDTDVDAAIFMNSDFSISILKDGYEIGKEHLYPNTRRHVKDVHYIYGDKSTDYIEEYTGDGQLYSILYYYNNQIQEINFLNANKLPIVTYFFYEKVVNYVCIRDEKNLNVIAAYPSLEEFISEEVARLTTENDTISISYMGLELSALSKTKSKNTLYLEESPLDENGKVKGNLEQILLNNINYVSQVVIEKKYFNLLAKTGITMEKITWI